MLSFKVYTLGCKVNIYESELVISLLSDNGYKLTSDKADIVIINTCTVTNVSDSKSKKIINKARKENEGAIIVVMGCYSQLKHNEVDADIIIGNKDKSQIVSLLDEYLINKKKIKRIYDLQKVGFENMQIKNFSAHTRAFVKIQDGCDAYCTYCIIPYVRGNIRSKTIKDVVNEITNLVNLGYKEIILSGIHTGKYGRDINTSLECLLRSIIKIPNLFRIRISSIEINELTSSLLDLISNSDIIAKHLHIPLQSGSDSILLAMNRKYDTTFFLNKITEIRKKIPNISITTDLIVGFPGETDILFKETLSFLNKVKFTKIHVFGYSKREGTVASCMNNQVNSDIKKQRVKEVIKLSAEYELKFYNSNIGKTYDIVVIKHNNIVEGFTTNYIPVIVNENVNTDIVSVKLEKVKKNKVVGKAIEVCYE